MTDNDRLTRIEAQLAHLNSKLDAFCAKMDRLVDPRGGLCSDHSREIATLAEATRHLEKHVKILWGGFSVLVLALLGWIVMASKYLGGGL